MNYLKHYADQVATISKDRKAGNISIEEGAIRLQAVAVLAEESAGTVDDPVYFAHLNKMADKIYSVIDKMVPEHRIIQ